MAVQEQYYLEMRPSPFWPPTTPPSHFISSRPLISPLPPCYTAMEYQLFQRYAQSLQEQNEPLSLTPSPEGTDEDMVYTGALDTHPVGHTEDAYFSTPQGSSSFIHSPSTHFHDPIPGYPQQELATFYPPQGGAGPAQNADAAHVGRWLSHSNNWPMSGSQPYAHTASAGDRSLGVYPADHPPSSNDSAFNDALGMYLSHQQLARPCPAPAPINTDTFARGAANLGTSEPCTPANPTSTGETIHFHSPSPQVISFSTPSPDADSAESAANAVHSLSATQTEGEPARTTDRPLSTDAGPSSSSALSVSLSMPSGRQRSNSKAAMTKALYKVLRRKLFPEVEGPMSRVTQLQAAIDRIIELEEEVARLQALQDIHRADATTYAPPPYPPHVAAETVPLSPGTGRGGGRSDGRIVKSKTWMPYTPHFQKVGRP
ncbi:hypothetical protein OF83DRAFT_119060 [Amylostereum chailletii]|nr:hypothetical protein OF83DRAFT_119060 [Amylostereum chailletii]